jgi:hypothetical protein
MPSFVPVTSQFIRQNNANFGITADVDNIGGLRVVTDIVARDAIAFITPSHLKIGMRVVVQSPAPAKLYRLTQISPSLVWIEGENVVTEYPSFGVFPNPMLADGQLAWAADTSLLYLAIDNAWFLLSDRSTPMSSLVPQRVDEAGASGISTAASRADHVHEAPAATNLNKFMGALVTTVDGDLATGTAVIQPPALGTYIVVMVNGVRYRVGDGTKVGVPCFFSDDGGDTAKAIVNIDAGDLLYWNGSVAGFELDNSDRIDLDYEAF